MLEILITEVQRGRWGVRQLKLSSVGSTHNEVGGGKVGERAGGKSSSILKAGAQAVCGDEGGGHRKGERLCKKQAEVRGGEPGPRQPECSGPGYLRSRLGSV